MYNYTAEGKLTTQKVSSILHIISTLIVSKVLYNIRIIVQVSSLPLNAIIAF